ncbi:MAG: beta-ketoacyl-[acyl-carrier-protein] synthase II, partial [Ottowia sp.]|nr:beta-ketoacyl-[acyl-carrier-protein] synthase II [Ottowia sp.]
MRIAHWTVTTAAGTGRDAFARALAANASALRRDDFSRAGLDTWIGRVEAVEALQLPAALQALNARVTRLAWLALQ